MDPQPADVLSRQQQKEFIRRPTRDLTRSTVGIVGLGGVGRRLARLLSAFETRILAVDMFPVDKPDWVESLWPAQRLDEMLPLVDFLVLSVPLNRTTRGMIDAAALEKMKPGAVLVNVARGPLVVESDLVAALESGHLAGAVMDVTEQEPLPASSKLWDLPQVIITPHVGGQARVAERQDHRFVLPQPRPLETRAAADQFPGGQAARFPHSRRGVSTLGRSGSLRKI